MSCETMCKGHSEVPAERIHASCGVGAEVHAAPLRCRSLPQTTNSDACNIACCAPNPSAHTDCAVLYIPRACGTMSLEANQPRPHMFPHWGTLAMQTENWRMLRIQQKNPSWMLGCNASKSLACLQIAYIPTRLTELLSKTRPASAATCDRPYEAFTGTSWTSDMENMERRHNFQYILATQVAMPARHSPQVKPVRTI